MPLLLMEKTEIRCVVEEIALYRKITTENKQTLLNIVMLSVL